MPPKRKRRAHDDADAVSVFYAASAGTRASTTTRKRRRARQVAESVAASSAVPSGIFDEVSSSASSDPPCEPSTDDEVGSVDGQCEQEDQEDTLSDLGSPAADLTTATRSVPSQLYASQRWAYEPPAAQQPDIERETTPPDDTQDFEAMLQEYRTNRHEADAFNRRAARQAMEVTHVNAPDMSPPREPMIDLKALRSGVAILRVVCEDEETGIVAANSVSQPCAKLLKEHTCDETTTTTRFGNTVLSSRASAKVKRRRGGSLGLNAVTSLKPNANKLGHNKSAAQAVSEAGAGVVVDEPASKCNAVDEHQFTDNAVLGSQMQRSFEATSVRESQCKPSVEPLRPDASTEPGAETCADGGLPQTPPPKEDRFLASLLAERNVWLAKPDDEHSDVVAADRTSVQPTTKPPPTVEQLIPSAYRSNMMVERYGFSYNLESVFLVEAVLCLRLQEAPKRVSVLVVRDRLGIESYWFPLRLMLKLCGFHNVWNTIRVYCPPDTVKRFDDLRQVYGIQVSVSSTVLYVNEEGLNAIFYANRRRQNIHEIDLVRQSVQHFYRCRRFVVGELVKQLANEYIQWSIPPR